MISRKIEERNEKIVRGLLKLPPNRKCINCNSLGPQYVCTNFWTFVCTTCGGIHREFTHRVKSISMSKFTTQEVEALQSGGNQRARELYFKGWDFQRQRLPDSSNVDRVREFIKNVYEDKKYVTGKISDGPSTDSQSPKSREEHRRASSYHSYSQSPPYDHQYEERKYGKRAPVLTRKPGSEKSLYEGKVSSFAYSPTRMREQAYDDRFTNEGSISRYSLHSESSGGDPFRSENMSPSSYSNHGFSSPAQASIGRTTSAFMEENARREVNKVPHPQRTLSSGSFGSFDRNAMSSDSYKPNTLVHTVPEHDQSEGGRHNDKLAFSTMEKHSSNGSSGTFDLFADPVASQPVASSTVDFYQLPKMSTLPVNLFQTSTFGTALTTSPLQSSETSPPSLNFFGDIPQNLHLTNLEQSCSELTTPENEGWATFDTQPVPSSHSRPFRNEPHKSDNVGKGSSFSLPPLSQNIHNEPRQSEGMNEIQAHNVAAGAYPSVPSPSSDIMPHNQAFSGASTSQPWNAFEDPMGHPHWMSIPQKIEPQFNLSMPSPDSDQFMNVAVMEGLKADAARSYTSETGSSFSNLYRHTSSEYNPVQQSYKTNYMNPFDLPFDLDPDANKVFLNMNSLGAALPSDAAQSAFARELTEPWLSHHPATTLPTSTTQASIPFMVGQSPTSQFTDTSPNGPFASIGGNPFA